ncbi:uncharacterized protein LOC135572651 [Oncorhynchus nerka]|uniref:uncharacterized protein LOC135572651 n=1 Tax=Oncorhynchus nerka TaxID=8023 RepID=UPI0031B7F4E1
MGGDPGWKGLPPMGADGGSKEGATIQGVTASTEARKAAPKMFRGGTQGDWQTPRIGRARVGFQPGRMVPAQCAWPPVCVFGLGYPAPALRTVSPVRLHSPVRPVLVPRICQAKSCETCSGSTYEASSDDPWTEASRDDPWPKACGDDPWPEAPSDDPEPAVMIHGMEPPVMIHGTKPPVIIHGTKPKVRIHGTEPPATVPGPEPSATVSGLEPPATVPSPEAAATVPSPEPAAAVHSPQPPALVCSPEPPAMIYGLEVPAMIPAPEAQPKWGGA